MSDFVLFQLNSDDPDLEAGAVAAVAARVAQTRALSFIMTVRKIESEMGDLIFKHLDGIASSYLFRRPCSRSRGRSLDTEELRPISLSRDI